MSKRGIFITGTDTGVGKTFVSAAIALLLRNNGMNVGVMKPVTSGCIEVDGKLVSEDAEILAWAAGIANDADCAPYLLRAPIAPSVAATREGIKIDFSHVRDSYERMANKHDFIIVEGAGGLMVPLCGGMLIADLVTALDLPLLVVARPNLGTVNHTVLTCFSAKQLGIDVRGVVVNNYPESPGITEEYAPHLLDSLAGAPLLGVFPHIEEESPKMAVGKLAQRLKSDPTTKILLREIGVESV